ncbi:hypothetical protein NQ317_019750 [Molorchus minor]|uniref:Gamma-interferon-inducible lysosomal thiol reductase n=1 Tax=Molorchus minor TaxID=1323400 RepID=A0ABQ9K4Y0_9CUCU|nr:hypothetical protein NQ317_019750 [Molorchus minor]
MEPRYYNNLNLTLFLGSGGPPNRLSRLQPRAPERGFEALNVTLHFRSYCSHCKAFFKEQLLPVYELLGDDVLNVEIIPNSINNYDDDGNLTPTCYSGEDECKAEQYQSCILSRDDYTQAQKIHFMGCIEAADDSAVVEDIQTCAEQFDIDWEETAACYDSGEGYQALINFNIIQHSYDKEIDHVPFIMYNGVVDYDIESDARANFLEVTCSYLTEKTSSCPIASESRSQNGWQNVTITVFYESLCPDCIDFVTNQLFPTYKKIGNDLNVDLVPFGNAEMTNATGNLTFVCQHGPNECYANKVHSCAVELYSVEESMEFVYCDMQSKNPSSPSNLERVSVSDLLLAKNGVRTKSFQPRVAFVPTVAFDNYFNETLQNNAQTNLEELVCRLLDYQPRTCKSYFENEVIDPIKVSVYYETLCPDSRTFIAVKLHPNYQDIANYVNLELIPYGKAIHSKTNGVYKFSCQHGQSECQGNKYHSCVLSMNNEAQTNVDIIDCIMRTRNPSLLTNVESCARKFKVDDNGINRIRSCSSSEEGERLLAENGDKTWKLEPSISFVPTVVYNDVYDKNSQDQSLIDFVAVVCSKINGSKPSICDNRSLPKPNKWGF